MRNIFLVAVFVISAFTANAQEVNWVSFEEALELNKKNPKPIMVDLYTDWCGWCKRMDATTYKNEVIVKFINDNYYAVKMDGEGKKDITFKGRTFKFVQNGRSKYHELAAAILNGKMSYPSTAFFNQEEQLIQSVPGYQAKEKFEKILAYFSGEAYKNTPWKDFEKNFKSAL
ncbi:thioredoxin family protein [Tenacibaculum sp. 190524A05c]|jgi:thioredoxin-related protein|uniref:thioredoxin family protein n=1 Tax=Tenacibaculum platacis TaxID=3137852 RepID=UPI0031FB9C9D